MTVDLLGPASDHAVTTRPARSNTRGPADTWFQDCSSSTAEDGTEYSADYFNDMLAQIRTLCRSAGIVLDNADDMVWRAVQSVGIRTGVDTGTPNHIVVPGLAPAFTAWIPNVPFVVQIGAANRNTGPVDITVNGLATKALRLPGFDPTAGLGEPLDLGDLEGHQIIICAYDAALDVVAMLTPIARSVIDQSLSFTFGTDFADVNALDRWASRRRVSKVGQVTAHWPAGVTTYSTLQSFQHPDSDRFSFIGGAVTSPPAGSSLVAAGSSSSTRAANKATNRATLLAAFATQIQFTGTGAILIRGKFNTFANVMGDAQGTSAVAGFQFLGNGGVINLIQNVAAVGFPTDGILMQQGAAVSNGIWAVGNGANGVELDAFWLTFQGYLACVNNGVHGITGVFGGYATADTAVPGRPDLNGNGNCGAFFDKVSGASLTGGASGAAKNNGLDGIAGVRCRMSGPVMTMTGNARYGASFFEAGGDISNSVITGNGVLDVFAGNGSVPTLTGSSYGTTSPAVNTTGNNLSMIVV